MVKKTILKCIGVLEVLMRKVKEILNIDTKYQCGDICILLPAYHMLPTFQDKHKLYDRFLPYLCRHLEAESTVIDIGANCGDTLAGMYSNNKGIKYVCVEPDVTFFQYLNKNISAIKRNDPNVAIIPLKNMVGNGDATVSLAGCGGTKKAVVGDVGKLKYESLDSLVLKNNIENISLIKSDVDGFDYDVIDSSFDTISRDMPILFFEGQLDYGYQLDGFVNAIRRLHSHGYNYWVLFDNYGEVVVSADNPEVVEQLFYYIWRQNTGRTTRTIHYFDVLAVSAGNCRFVQDVVGEYINSK